VQCLVVSFTRMHGLTSKQTPIPGSYNAHGAHNQAGNHMCTITIKEKRGGEIQGGENERMSGFLPRAPLARTLGAEESYIYVYVYV